jgi:hypothetical protein
MPLKDAESVKLRNAFGFIDTSNPLPVQLDGDFAINTQLNSGNSNIEYIGIAPIGSATSAAVWKIKRVNYTTGTVIEYADGNENFDNIFDNRESLTYS